VTQSGDEAIEVAKLSWKVCFPRTNISVLSATRRPKPCRTQLLKNLANIPTDLAGDLFGQICEYFLAEFAGSEGFKDGELF
jgi:hypothetical protein